MGIARHVGEWLNGIRLWLQLALAWGLAVFVARCRSVAVKIGFAKAAPPAGMDGTPIRIAVIGGGIAGTSAAWALNDLKSRLPDGSPQLKVTLFEERTELGGNAKTHKWVPKGSPNDDAASVRTGLSVLGWPAAYFKNYEVLMRRLEIAREEVQPKFVVSTDGETVSWAHGEAPGKWAEDMRRWDRAVTAIRTINDWFARGLPAKVAGTFFGGRAASKHSERLFASAKAAPSFYEVSMLNPMNLISARFVMCTVFGVSADFWNVVVVSVYSSSFLTGVLDGVPAVIIPALDDIISVGAADPVKTLHTWSENSSKVFDALADGIHRRNIVLDAKLESIMAVVDNATGRVRQRIVRQGVAPELFDHVVFACPANAVDRLTKSCPRIRTFLFNTVIRNIRYETQRDRNFVHGDIHTDRAVLPASIQQQFFSKRFSNYVRMLDRETGSCCNVFALGTWIPPALAHANQRRHARLDGGLAMETRYSGGALDLYVSYDAQYNLRHPKVKAPMPERLAGRSSHPEDGPPQRKPAAEHILGAVDNSSAHPVLSPLGMALAASLSQLQGAHGVYFCGSYATPGNGHDLSHLSGVATAAALMERIMGRREAPWHYYCHLGHADDAAIRDFVFLRNLMGL
jgi:predicted NAD/FAD-binding protein